MAKPDLRLPEQQGVEGPVVAVACALGVRCQSGSAAHRYDRPDRRRLRRCHSSPLRLRPPWNPLGARCWRRVRRRGAAVHPLPRSSPACACASAPGGRDRPTRRHRHERRHLGGVARAPPSRSGRRARCRRALRAVAPGAGCDPGPAGARRHGRCRGARLPRRPLRRGGGAHRAGMGRPRRRRHLCPAPPRRPDRCCSCRRPSSVGFYGPRSAP